MLTTQTSIPIRYNSGECAVNNSQSPFLRRSTARVMSRSLLKKAYNSLDLLTSQFLQTLQACVRRTLKHVLLLEMSAVVAIDVGSLQKMLRYLSITVQLRGG